MSDEVAFATVGAVGLSAVAVTIARWWKGRSQDVPASTRAAAVALALTAGLLPWLLLAKVALGPVAVFIYALSVPVAWFLVGVIGVHEQRVARTRDTELGAVRRPVLWHPYLAGAFAFAVLNVLMTVTLVLWFAIAGTLHTSTVIAVASACLCGTMATAAGQATRRHCAGGRSAGITALARSAHRRSVTAATGAAGAAGISAGVLVASRLSIADGDLHAAAVLLATAPGWGLLTLAWVLVDQRPRAAVTDAGRG